MGLTVDQLVDGVLGGDRSVLARAITLVESNRDSHRREAQEVLARLLPHTGGAHRIGISGPPGAGKSTLVEVLGMRLVKQGRRVAVLAIDPSSPVSGGSILGDKTRMTRLSGDPRAFVRPSPSGGALGGVHRKTRESLLLCEAAGFDTVIVETVGVGQSEVSVADLVDTFLVVLSPGAGDELQGIKKGILERVDLLAIGKADGEQEGLARTAVVQFSAAMRLLRPGAGVEVLAVSAVSGAGVTELQAALEGHRVGLGADGLERRRAGQRREWMWSIVHEELLRELHGDAEVARMVPEVEAAVLAGTEPPTRGAERVLGVFRRGR